MITKIHAFANGKSIANSCVFILCAVMWNIICYVICKSAVSPYYKCG